MFNIKRIFVLILIGSLLVGCKQDDSKNSDNETILKGSASLFVDETLVPIMEDQVAIFESKYDAEIKIIPKSESEIILSLLEKKSGIAILTRNLTIQENKIFEQKKIIPKITKFAVDAIAFISNERDKDTLIDLKDVVEFMQGKNNSKIKGLVFDNPNSSTVRYMRELANIKTNPEKGVFSFKTNQEVIKFVADNEGMVGVVGLNWLTQPAPKMRKYVEKVHILSVKGLADKNYYSPTQNNIAEGKYPLARDLFIINGQGYSGLGMGFASFVAGDVGQRIILKSGLLPIRIPGRKFNVRYKINNDEK